MKQSSEITVHGSTPSIFYTVNILQSGDRHIIKCSCTAGENRQLCKHVLAAIEGDKSNLVAGQDRAWKEWRSVFSRSELGVLAHDFFKESEMLEKRIQSLQQKARGVKKGFAKAALVAEDRRSSDRRVTERRSGVDRRLA